MRVLQNLFFPDSRTRVETPDHPLGQYSDHLILSTHRYGPPQFITPTLLSRITPTWTQRGLVNIVAALNDPKSVNAHFQATHLSLGVLVLDTKKGRAGNLNIHLVNHRLQIGPLLYRQSLYVYMGSNFHCQHSS